MDETTLLGERAPWAQDRRQRPPIPMLVLVWSVDAPERVGEVVWHDTLGPGVIGRGHTGPGALQLWRITPQGLVPTGPLRTRGISRQQLRVEATRGGLQLANTGRARMLVNGAEHVDCAVTPGDVIELRYQALFLCVRRSPDDAAVELPDHPFGSADRFGIIGESSAIWRVRDQLLQLGPRAEHVLVHGPSGSGKELIAQALHQIRGQGPWVSRNAATIPEGLVDAELFGNIRDYPNPGMPARPGLIGEAHGGTLFLDEIGELPIAHQARLLRVMDAGEYHRLGAAGPQVADLRVVGATNRAPTALKSDVLARFAVRIELPGLDQRREDIPLIAAGLVRDLVRDDPRWSQVLDDQGHPRFTSDLMTALLRAPWTTHVRELRHCLLRCLAQQPGPYLDAPDGLFDAPPPAAPTLTAERVREMLDAHNWHRARTADALGLSSRHQLARLMKKLGIESR